MRILLGPRFEGGGSDGGCCRSALPKKLGGRPSSEVSDVARVLRETLGASIRPGPNFLLDWVCPGLAYDPDPAKPTLRPGVRD